VSSQRSCALRSTSARSHARRRPPRDVTPRMRHSIYWVLGMAAFSSASFLIFQGYLTPEMMMYFLSFKWCF